MGNSCEQCIDMDRKKEFTPIDSSNQQLRMIPIKQEVLQSRYSQQILVKSKQPSHIDRFSFKDDLESHRSDPLFNHIQKPQLSSKVKEALDRQLQENPLALNSEYKGEPRPIEFLSQKNLHYQGQWLDNQPHGKGSVFFSQGSYLQAYFNKGEASCKDAILVFADGSLYRGQIKNSLFSGKGRLVASNGTVYRGDWKNGVPDGQGEQTFPNGNSYVGSFAKGLKSGNGIFRWSDGKVYEGEFRDGKMHGSGKLQKGHQLFEGTFKDNKKVGKCKLKTTYGVYNSEFKEGEITGKGTFQFKNHTVYRGDFEKGLPHGEGTIQLPNGQIIKGIFEHGETRVVDVIKKGQQLD